MKEKIRPTYNELQGYLSQAPNKDVWDDGGVAMQNQLNITVDQLSEMTGDDYSRFKVRVSGERTVLDINSYRTNLGGLISRIHGLYFSDEAPPFSGGPSTVITQNQHQSQSMNVQVLLEVQSKIDLQLPNHKEGTPERNFLERVKAGLGSVKSVTELISLILKTGKEVGLSVDKILSLFT